MRMAPRLSGTGAVSAVNVGETPTRPCKHQPATSDLSTCCFYINSEARCIPGATPTTAPVCVLPSTRLGSRCCACSVHVLYKNAVWAFLSSLKGSSNVLCYLKCSARRDEGAADVSDCISRCECWCAASHTDAKNGSSRSIQKRITFKSRSGCFYSAQGHHSREARRLFWLFFVGFVFLKRIEHICWIWENHLPGALIPGQMIFDGVTAVIFYWIIHRASVWSLCSSLTPPKHFTKL